MSQLVEDGGFCSKCCLEGCLQCIGSYSQLFPQDKKGGRNRRGNGVCLLWSIAFLLFERYLKKVHVIQGTAKNKLFQFYCVVFYRISVSECCTNYLILNVR